MDTSPELIRPNLSERQLDVLRLLALGHTHDRVARELHLSQDTVKTHRERASDMYNQLGRPTPNMLTLYQALVADGFIDPVVR